MENLKMHTPDMAEENFKKLAELFPNAVTETITGYDENGRAIIERAVDADVLRQEISAAVVEGGQERYQFTWPDKKKSVVLANQPIAKTLRLVREKSVGRDGTPGSIDTENIYIEGDNLDALKLLQETYLGQVKMIYIDPPYNTGSDFIYDDDFSRDRDEYLTVSGQFDEDGGRLVQNPESNGRFHTDWLNMIYPRLRIAKDFLSDDGVIFISIDDNEVENLKKICDEIFGAGNFVGLMTLLSNPRGSQNSKYLSYVHEYILMYGKNVNDLVIYGIEKLTESLNEYSEEDEKGKYRLLGLRKRGGAWKKEDRPNMFYPIYVNPNTGAVSLTQTNDYCIEVIPKRPTGELSRWSWSKQKFEEENSLLVGKAINRAGETNAYDIFRKDYIADENGKIKTTKLKTIWLEKETNYQNAKNEIRALFGNSEIFDFPKPTHIIKTLLSLIDSYSIVMDFFSGSATTAHAVMKLNAEDEGHRKFILVQLPEATPENSEAHNAGYKNICEIGEERIRRAGKKIREESPLTTGDLDTGFRVFRVDSSNMEDVYYRPSEFKQGQLSAFAENIKPDRTPEDLLFQVMLDLGVILSSKIEETVIAGKKVFSVADDFLIACFDNDITEETVKAIAKRQPSYAVFRDSGMAGDSVMTNFEQIFETYSPKTQRKVL